jgi:hypothetical protein
VVKVLSSITTAGYDSLARSLRNVPVSDSGCITQKNHADAFFGIGGWNKLKGENTST